MQFWGGDVNHRALPGCEPATVVVTLPVTVTVLDAEAAPQEGLGAVALQHRTGVSFWGLY